MSKYETIATIEHGLRPLAAYFPAEMTTKLYSSGKRNFMQKISESIPDADYSNNRIQPVKLWDIEFNTPLFNSAGMFKYGKGYQFVARQGAGAFLSGTTTSLARKGNKKQNIFQPFHPFPRSKAAINWLGLPNPGHSKVAKELSKIEKIDGCPIGASLYKDNTGDKLSSLKDLVKGLFDYEKAGVDFIEINESCPNVEKGEDTEVDQSLLDRLEYISNNFIKKIDRNLPLIVKFSNDTDLAQVKSLIKNLIDLSYSGANFGNTSTEYELYDYEIHPKERHQYYYFYKTFGGGLSGNPLKQKSLELSKLAQETANDYSKQEFNIIRTGGIEELADIKESEKANIRINQWYTGYWDAFSKHGNRVYKEIFNA